MRVAVTFELELESGSVSFGVARSGAEGVPSGFPVNASSDWAVGVPGALAALANQPRSVPSGKAVLWAKASSGIASCWARSSTRKRRKPSPYRWRVPLPETQPGCAMTKPKTARLTASPSPGG